MSRFSFGYFLDRARPVYVQQLRLHLFSLERYGGAAWDYPRFLMYAGDPATPEAAELRRVCHDGGVEIVPVTAPFRSAFDSKLCMFRIPAGETACLMDLDTLFLGDPTPALERAEALNCLLAIPGPLSPVRHFTSRPWLAPLDRAFDARGRALWRALFRRFAAERPPPPERLNQEGKRVYPYPNGGVLVAPRVQFTRLEPRVAAVTAFLQKQAARRGAVARHLCLHHTDQLALGIAGYALDLLREDLGYEYNFAAGCTRRPELRSLLLRGEVRIAHVVTTARPYLAAGTAPEPPEQLRPFIDRVRAILDAAGEPGLLQSANSGGTPAGPTGGA